jgi:hypothetical protein
LLFTQEALHLSENNTATDEESIKNKNNNIVIFYEKQNKFYLIAKVKSGE